MHRQSFPSERIPDFFHSAKVRLDSQGQEANPVPSSQGSIWCGEAVAT